MKDPGSGFGTRHVSDLKLVFAACASLPERLPATPDSSNEFWKRAKQQNVILVAYFRDMQCFLTQFEASSPSP